MSSDALSEKAKQTLKAVRDLFEKAEDSTERAFKRAAPAVQKSVDSSVDAAAKGFASSMKAIDGATATQQLELLKAYKKFISGQGQLVDSRIKSLEEKARPKAPAST